MRLPMYFPIFVYQLAFDLPPDRVLAGAARRGAKLEGEAAGTHHRRAHAVSFRCIVLLLL